MDKNEITQNIINDLCAQKHVYHTARVGNQISFRDLDGNWFKITVENMRPKYIVKDISLVEDPDSDEFLLPILEALGGESIDRIYVYDSKNNEEFTKMYANNMKFRVYSSTEKSDDSVYCAIQIELRAIGERYANLYNMSKGSPSPKW